MPLAEAKADVDIALVYHAEVVSVNVFMLNRFYYFKFSHDILFHLDPHPLDCQRAAILVLSLVDLGAVAASNLSVLQQGYRFYLSILRGIIVFIRKRKPNFEDVLLCELSKSFKLFDIAVKLDFCKIGWLTPIWCGRSFLLLVFLLRQGGYIRKSS